MKKSFIIILLIIITSSCAGRNNTKPKGSQTSTCSERYTPITNGVGDFRTGIISAMSDKACAAYAVGYSESNIKYLLENEFQHFHENFYNGEFKNVSLDSKMTCSYIVTTLASKQFSDQRQQSFQEILSSSMSLGQKKSLDSSISKEYANEILKESARKLIIRAAKKF